MQYKSHSQFYFEPTSTEQYTRNECSVSCSRIKQEPFDWGLNSSLTGIH